MVQQNSLQEGSARADLRRPDSRWSVLVERHPVFFFTSPAAAVIFVCAFVLVIFHSPLGIAAGLALLAAGVAVFLYTWRLYQETKEWLEANAASGEEKH